MAFTNRGAAWLKKGEFDKALADCDEAIRLNPKHAMAHTNRGATWHKKGRYDKALADLDEAIRLEPGTALAYRNLAWIRATCPESKYRNGPQAVASATRGCELTGWKDANHIGTLAAASAESGDFAAAVKWQIRADALFPEGKGRTVGEARLKEFYQAGMPYHEPKP